MNVDLTRIQFTFTPINHFFFVPVTIGLAFLTALRRCEVVPAGQGQCGERGGQGQAGRGEGGKREPSLNAAGEA